jgi:NADP-dependent 3-hydroxy acid dehydrogenase YdfG
VGRSRALDVADADGLRVFVDEVVREFGRIDVLVNNAGQNSPRRRLLTTTPDEIRALFDANVLGAMFCTRAVLPSMRAAGKGTIVNVSSTAALEPGVLTGAAYSAAKAALENFTRYLAQETRNSGIRTCVVFPGEVDTPILEHRAHPPDAAARATMLRSEDVAEAIALVLRLPARAAITELVIKPTHLRSVDAELQKE